MQIVKEQGKSGKRSNRHPLLAHIRMDRYRHHGAESDMNGAAQVEKSGIDIVGASIGITDQYGLVWDDGGSVQRWSKVDVI